mmetsp:Transcript_27507/g.92585  ORF Transcript_27507/g.92585 Transcript_27507/m.92585 type:complete len:279 (-) Transcript_27507:73-909(-)
MVRPPHTPRARQGRGRALRGRARSVLPAGPLLGRGLAAAGPGRRAHGPRRRVAGALGCDVRARGRERELAVADGRGCAPGGRGEAGRHRPRMRGRLPRWHHLPALLCCGGDRAQPRRHRAFGADARVGDEPHDGDALRRDSHAAGERAHARTLGGRIGRALRPAPAGDDRGVRRRVGVAHLVGHHLLPVRQGRLSGGALGRRVAHHVCTPCARICPAAVLPLYRGRHAHGSWASVVLHAHYTSLYAVPTALHFTTRDFGPPPDPVLQGSSPRVGPRVV